MDWESAARAVRAGSPICRFIMVDGPDLGTHFDAYPPCLGAMGDQRVFVEPILPPPGLIVAGAGHIGAALAPAARAAGFLVTVVDDRAEYAVEERFPGCTVIYDDMAAALGALKGQFVVLAGRSHDKDREALRAAARRDWAYLGMVGSRRKVETLRRDLGLEGMPLRAPIGLDIGAETPAEIAVAIVAEMIAVRRGGSGAPLSSAGRATSGTQLPAGTVEAQQVWLAVADLVDAGAPFALATIIAVAGSTPRSAGATMLIRPDGSAVGTIGGGKWEAEVRQTARELLDEPQPNPTLLHPRYLDESDMICGGSAEVFIEPVVRRRA